MIMIIIIIMNLSQEIMVFVGHQKLTSALKQGQKSDGRLQIWCSIREYGSTLYVGLARAVSPTNTNFRLSFLLTWLKEALYEDLTV